MSNTKCKFVENGKCTNPCAEAIECPKETYDKESSYECCDWYAAEASSSVVEQTSNYKRKTIQHGDIKFYEPVYCKGSNIDYLAIREQLDKGIKSCDIADYRNISYTDEDLIEIYHEFADLEDRIESGELGDVTAYKHRIEVLEKALKNVINEYTYDGEVTVPGCEECDIAFGRPSKKCLQTQFDRLIEQAEKELKEEKQ